MEKRSNRFNWLSNIWKNHKVPLSIAGGTAAAAGGIGYGINKAKGMINDSINQGIQKGKTALTETLNDPNIQNRVNQIAASGTESALQSLSDRIFTLPNMGKIMAVGALATLPSMLMNATASKSPSISVNAGGGGDGGGRMGAYRRYRQRTYNPYNYYSFRAAR